MLLKQKLLKRELAVSARAPAVRIDIQVVLLKQRRVVEIIKEVELEIPIAGIEGGVAVIKFERDGAALLREQACAAAKKVLAVWRSRAHAARSGHARAEKAARAFERENIKRVLAPKRPVAFDLVLIVGVESSPCLRTALIGRRHDAPTVGHGFEMKRVRRLRKGKGGKQDDGDIDYSTYVIEVGFAEIISCELHVFFLQFSR